jgi:hypothetical protein
MNHGFYTSIACIAMSTLFGIWLASYNLKELKRTKEQRMAAYRIYKKKKNEKLRKFLGL